MAKLSDREEAVLLAMADHLPNEYAAPFRNINTYVRNRHPEQTGCETWNIRRAVRSLARKGMTELVRGLMTDDGMLMGSGYGVTPAGRRYAKAVFDAAATPD